MWVQPTLDEVLADIEPMAQIYRRCATAREWGEWYGVPSTLVVKHLEVAAKRRRMIAIHRLVVCGRVLGRAWGAPRLSQVERVADEILGMLSRIEGGVPVSMQDITEVLDEETSSGVVNIALNRLEQRQLIRIVKGRINQYEVVT